MFSVCDRVKTPDKLTDTLLKLKSMGYENAQFSGIPDMPAEVWAEISKTTGMEIVCTHNDFDRIVNDTDSLIAEHRQYNCSVIGLGSMPSQYIGTFEGVLEFIKVMEEPVKKIKAAGMSFSYHNHWWEFEPFKDAEGCAMDVMIERCADWLFLIDVAWVEYAGRSAVEYMQKVGKARLRNIHLKDFKEKGVYESVCPCGKGIVPMPEIIKLCEAMGVENALVEQDNASATENSLAEMQCSYDYLRPLIVKA